MTNRKIEERLSRAVRRETPNVLNQVLSARAEKERGIDMTGVTDLSAAKRSKKWIAWTAAAAACVLLVVGGGFAANYRYGVDSIVALDVNPSIELTANRGEKVLDVRALNDDGSEVLDGMNLRGTSLDIAMNALVGSMVRHGYIDEAKNSVLITVENSDTERGRELQQKLAADINEVFQGSEITPAVLGQEVSADDELKAFASQYQISTGRAALIRRVLELNPNLTADQLAGLNVNDLSLLLLAREPESGLVAYGEVSDASYIGEARAKEIALAQKPGAKVRKVEFDYEDGRPVYEVKCILGATEYEYEIDAVSGRILKSESEPADNAALSSAHSDMISTGEAKKIALRHAGVTESEAAPVKAELDRDDSPAVYEVEFTAKGAEYDYKIDAVSGRILKAEKKADDDSSGPVSPSDMISTGEAKKIALRHAGVTESEAAPVKAELDRDESPAVYEVEFTAKGAEYDYKIDAVSGKILKAEQESDHTLSVSGGSSSAAISKQRAKEIALAKAPGATVGQVKLEQDDGRAVYELELHQKNTKFSCEIDANTGDVLQWEEEIDD